MQKNVVFTHPTLVRKITFRLSHSQCMLSQSTNVTDGRTDRQTTCHNNTAHYRALRSSDWNRRQEAAAAMQLYFAKAPPLPSYLRD